MVDTKRRYTIDAWIESPDNTMLAELVDGVPVGRMSTTPSHGDVIGELWDWLRSAQRAGYGRVFAGPVGVLLDASSGRRNVREPDLCFVVKERGQIITDKAIEGLPDLVIEVLSPGNREDDLPGGSVWNDYERFGVPTYWIVDPEARTVAQYQHAGLRYGLPIVVRPGDVLRFASFPDIVLPADDVFREQQPPEV